MLCFSRYLPLNVGGSFRSFPHACVVLALCWSSRGLPTYVCGSCSIAKARRSGRSFWNIFVVVRSAQKKIMTSLSPVRIHTNRKIKGFVQERRAE